LTGGSFLISTDAILLAVAFVLIGVMTIYSANYDVIQRHAGALPGRQLTWLGLGLIALFAALAFDYHYIDRIAYPFTARCFYSWCWCFSSAIRAAARNAGSTWLFRLQPSERRKSPSSW
jgi:cell division protein FtsW (lipid II flippase)